MTGKVYDTIKKLFAAQNGATLSSIVSYSGLSKQHVLNVLAANKRLFQYKPGTSKIVRLSSSLTGEALKAAKKSGQFFWEEKVNYGAETIWDFPEGVNSAADTFRRPYTCGGLGDSYTVNVVSGTSGNEAKLRAIGMKRLEEADLSKFPGYVEWVEDTTDGKQGGADTVNRKLLDFVRGLLHRVDDFGNGYVGCEGKPCRCEQCIKVRALLADAGDVKA